MFSFSVGSLFGCILQVLTKQSSLSLQHELGLITWNLDEICYKASKFSVYMFTPDIDAVKLSVTYVWSGSLAPAHKLS